MFFAYASSQCFHGCFIHQGKQIGFIHHVQEVCLILFLFVVDRSIIVDDDVEGIAAFRLNSNELLIGCLVIEKITGIGIALIVDRFTFGKYRRCVLRLGGIGHILRLSCLSDGEILVSVIGISKCRHGEAAYQHHAKCQNGEQTETFSFIHSQLPPDA